jgi:hypothetical protein
VLDDVRRLQRASDPALGDVEHVLTDGYACVMRTEGERRRLRGRLEERAATMGDGQTEEITALAQGIARADSEIEELRAALGRLAVLARTLRAD